MLCRVVTCTFNITCSRQLSTGIKICDRLAIVKYASKYVLVPFVYSIDPRLEQEIVRLNLFMFKQGCDAFPLKKESRMVKIGWRLFLT